MQVSGSVGGYAAAQAQGGGHRGGPPSGVRGGQRGQKMKEMFDKADIDGNGAVSRQEITDAMADSGEDTSKVDEIFSKLDANGDGEITQAEGQQAREQMRGTEGRGGPGKTGRPNLLEMLDKNGDGSITESELEAMKKSLVEQFGSENGSAIYEKVLEGVDKIA